MYTAGAGQFSSDRRGADVSGGGGALTVLPRS